MAATKNDYETDGERKRGRKWEYLYANAYKRKAKGEVSRTEEGGERRNSGQRERERVRERGRKVEWWNDEKWRGSKGERGGGRYSDK